MVKLQIFLGMFTLNFGEDSHFDEHIFQRGWFNHRLDLVCRMWGWLEDTTPFSFVCFIATSHDLDPQKVAFWREISRIQGNLGS